ncbi:MAG: class I SAM-dependent methyltransferase [Cyanobacteria bacterium P01_A01_bin.40]
MKQWYEELFTNYALKYDRESFVQGTIGECDFIEQEINHDQNTRILDIGCGTGRHSLELATRGYDVTGIDLSESQLNRAKEKASTQDLSINFERQDARKLTFDAEFDLVIMLCEGGFSLMETDEMNFQILQNASKALKPKGKLIFTTLNGLFPLFHSVSEFFASATKEGNAEYNNNSFDLMTFRDRHTIKIQDDCGITKELDCNERYYVPSEITWLLKTLNFQVIDICAAKLGAFSRQDRLTTKDYEMLVIAEK